MNTLNEDLKYLGPEIIVSRLSPAAELAELAREHRFLIAGLIGLVGSAISADTVFAGGLLQDGVELPGWFTKEMLGYLISGSAGGLIGSLLSAGWEKILGKPVVLGVDQTNGKITRGVILPANRKEIIGNAVEGIVPGFAVGILAKVLLENPFVGSVGICSWWLLSKTYKFPIDTSSMKLPNGKGIGVGQFFKIYLATKKLSSGTGLIEAGTEEETETEEE